MINFHTRVVALTYTTDEVPEFKTAEERKAWYQALGYLVAYGLHTPDNEPADHSMDLITMYFSKYLERINVGYFKPVIQERYEDGSLRYLGTPEEKLNQLKEALASSPMPFSIGAVLGEDGKWGFHS